MEVMDQGMASVTHGQCSPLQGGVIVLFPLSPRSWLHVFDSGPLGNAVEIICKPLHQEIIPSVYRARAPLIDE